MKLDEDEFGFASEQLPYRLSFITRVCGLARCSPTLGCRELDFSGSFPDGGLVMHAVGWLEGGLRSSFEKFALDVETLHMMVKYLEPVAVNDTTLAFEEIKTVGHGGHFFDAESTIENFSTAIYEPIVAMDRPRFRAAPASRLCHFFSNATRLFQPVAKRLRHGR